MVCGSNKKKKNHGPFDTCLESQKLAESEEMIDRYDKQELSERL